MKIWKQIKRMSVMHYSTPKFLHLHCNNVFYTRYPKIGELTHIVQKRPWLEVLGDFFSFWILNSTFAPNKSVSTELLFMNGTHQISHYQEWLVDIFSQLRFHIVKETSLNGIVVTDIVTEKSHFHFKTPENYCSVNKKY